MKLSEREKEKLIERAAARLNARPRQPISVVLDVESAVCLIGQLQLALRHPANTDDTALVANKFVRTLVDLIAPFDDELRDFLMLGFDPEGDTIQFVENNDGFNH